MFHIGEDLFFGLHLICLPEKNRGRGLSPPMLKLGQNWGKITNYPPPMLNKDRHPDGKNRAVINNTKMKQKPIVNVQSIVE